MTDRPRYLRIYAFVVACAAWASFVSVHAKAPQYWPQFRGVGSAGLAELSPDDLPAQFTQDDYRWEIKLGGTGFGSPAVWAGKAFVLTCSETTGLRQVVCVSVDDGKVLWRKDYRLGGVRHHKDNSLAASTPAVDANRVVVCWASSKEATVHGLDHEGNEKWRRSLGACDAKHGPCITPIIHEGKVYVANDNLGPSVLMAINAANGEIKWRVERPAGRAGYGTPLIYRPAGGAGPQLVVSSTAAGIAGYDLDTGKPLWAAPDANPLRVVASPMQVGDLIVGSSGTGGRGKWIIAVRPPKAPGGKAQTAWKLEQDAHYVPTPLADGGKLFTVHDGGLLACYDGATGKPHWKQKLQDRFYGSPVVAAGRIYVISRSGVMYCYRAGAMYELLGKTDLGEPSFATPAFAGRKMLLRTHTRLICAEKK